MGRTYINVSMYLYTYRYVTRVLLFTIVPHRSRTVFNKRKQNSTLNVFKFLYLSTDENPTYR